eukprot:g3563.t1
MSEGGNPKMPKMPKVPKGAARAGSFLGKLAIGLGAAGTLVYQSLYTVEPGHASVTFNRLTGVSDTVRGEGTYILIPWLMWPIIFDVRTRPKQITSRSGTKDLQMVSLSIRILSRPDSRSLKTIYEKLGQAHDEVVLPSIVNETCKEVVAKFDAQQLLSKRQLVSLMIADRLKERAQNFNLILEDVALVDLDFTREFRRAVEEKKVAQQEAQRAAYLVTRAKQEKEGKIIQAEARAKEIELIGKAIKKDPGFVRLRRIEAAADIANTVSKGANKMYLDSESLMLNLEGVDRDTSYGKK